MFIRTALVIGGVIALFLAVFTVFPEQWSSGKGYDDVTALRKEFSGLSAELDALRRRRLVEIRTLENRDDDVTSVWSEIASLSSRLAALERELAMSSAANDAASGSGELPFTVEPLTAEIALEQADERMHASFDAEAVDAGWSADVEQELIDAFSNAELPGVSLYDAVCKTTLCRLEIEHEEPAQTLEVESWFPQTIAESLPQRMLLNKQVNGRTITVVFLARAGHPLPDTAAM